MIGNNFVRMYSVLTRMNDFKIGILSTHLFIIFIILFYTIVYGYLTELLSYIMS